MIESQKFEAPFQLITTKITQFTMSNDFLELNDSQDLNRTVEIDYNIQHSNQTEKIWQGVLDLIVQVTVAEKEENGKILTCQLSIRGYFIGAPALGGDQFENMLKINGSSTLYSIARGFLISISSQSLKQGQIVLPMMNFVDFVNLKEENNNEQREQLAD